MTDQRMVWQFMHDRLGLHQSADFRGMVWVPDEFTGAVAQMDQVAIAVGYNAFIGRTCCMHAVIQRPEYVSPRIVREVFRYPFVECDCEAVLALVDSVNDAAMSFDERLGFKQIASIPNGGLEGDLNVLQMLRGDCRWLRSH
jgi:hypothetical protein